MRNILLFVAVVVAIFPLHWLHIVATSGLPHGTSPGFFWLVCTAVIAVDAALFFAWFATRPPRAVREQSGRTESAIARYVRKSAERRAAEIKAEQQAAAAREQRLSYAQTGELTPIDPGNVLLRSGESAYAVIRASLHENRDVETVGRSSGSSVEVMKGIYLRSGTTRSQTVQRVVTLAEGILTATDKRVIFTGDKQSLSMTYQDLVSVQYANDGVSISAGGPAHYFFTGQSSETTVFNTILERLARAEL